MNEIKPCPFCGGEAFYIKIMGNYEKPHEIYCSKCDGAITEGRSEKQVVTNWNTRPIEDALNKRIIEVTNLYLQTKDAFDVATEILLKQDARIAELESIANELFEALTLTYNKLPEHWRKDYCPYDYHFLKVKLERAKEREE